MGNFGASLRQWRKSRGLSQLQLGLSADVSSRHISFLEGGRSQPSRQMIIQISNALNIPLSDRNTLLSLAGFAEAYSRMQLEQPEMKAVKDALAIMLNNHAPYPAQVLDWNWNIVMANEPQQKLIQGLASEQPDFPETNNLLELLFDPNALRPYVENWEEVAFTLIQRIHRERALYQDRRSDLIEKLMQYPGVPTSWAVHHHASTSAPMIQLVLNLGTQRLKLFSSLATFGTAIDVTMQELTIEQYFPGDEATRLFFEGLV